MSSKWNFEDNGAPKLSNDFRDAHIINIKGKEAVTANGLVVLGHEKGLKKLTTTILQFPNSSNDNTCIIQADLIGYGWSPAENKVVEVEFSAIGDANPKNCTAMVAAAFIRMAETRAVGRVMRNYTNIGMLCSDEIGSATEEQVSMISPNQVNQITMIMKQNAISKEQAREAMISSCSKTDIRALTEKEANLLIEVLKKIQGTPQA
jgi:hypothetical protein